jgi:hypothetical protein
MSITVQVITDQAAIQLVDQSHVTWPVANLISYLNEALRATALVKPDLVVNQTVVTLAAGVLQSIPADGIALIDIKRNAIGTKRVISEVDQQLLDEVQRFWPAATQSATVEHYTTSVATPRQFDVYPPNDGTGQVLMVYGAVPALVSAVGDTLPVLEIYQQPLVQYVVSRAYAANTKRQDLTKEANAKQAWAQAIGAKSQAQAAISPRVASQPGVA